MHKQNGGEREGEGPEISSKLYFIKKELLFGQFF
jgi:hypothetical protein